MYKHARMEANLTLKEAAQLLHVGQTSLVLYESLERFTPADVADRMSIIYKDPSLAVKHCLICPNGRKNHLIWLDQIDMGFPAIIGKLKEEIGEAEPLLPGMFNALVNKRTSRDLSPFESQAVRKATRELRDIRHNIEILFVRLEEFDPALVEQLNEEHIKKCIAHGYASTEKDYSRQRVAN